jgi:hypothetical protein
MFRLYREDTVTYAQVLLPPHTPQLSTLAPTQHMPVGGRAVEQHTPNMSTATLVPLQTPQTSTLPLVQHRPALSTSLPLGQHRPLLASMKPAQHVPAVSTTPSSQEGTPGGTLRSGIEQSFPSQSLLH